VFYAAYNTLMLFDKQAQRKIEKTNFDSAKTRAETFGQLKKETTLATIIMKFRNKKTKITRQKISLARNFLATQKALR
ncbi:MAG: hypothetical protein ACI4QH_02785, partial [Candidatus Fimimonas sp.]